MFPTVIKMTETRPHDVTVRNWRRVTRGAHEAQARLWWTKFLPRHFQAAAKFQYGYRPRSDRYAAQKEARYGKPFGPVEPDRDLVFSGDLRRAATGHALIRGFPSRGRVSLNVPRYVPARQRTTKQPPIADELTRVTRSEANQLSNFLNENMRTQLDAIRAVRVTVAA